VKGCTTSKISESIEVINDLLNAGANINSEEGEEGKTALILACEKGYIELVKYILA
jgi:ankyrin repeat protein